MSRMSLEDARKLLGWSQVRLAKEAGERTSAVFDLESGRNKRPAYILVMNIFRALQRGGLKGVSVEDIFPLPDPPTATKRGRTATTAPSPITETPTPERRAKKDRREKSELAVAS